MSGRVRGAVASLGPAQPPPVAGPPIRTGLDRLLPAAREVDLDQVAPDPDQPRKSFDPTRLDNLCGSIMEYGLLQPLLVRETELDERGDMHYQVIAGGRRLAALRLAQERCVDPVVRARLRRVAVVLARGGDARNRVLQLLENLQRADLAPLEEAHAYQEIIDLERILPPALAERLHVSAQTVRNRLRLLHDEVIADGVRRGALTVSAAQEAQKLADDGLAEVYERLRAGESVSVAQAQEIRARLLAAGVVNPRRKRQKEQPIMGNGTAAAVPVIAALHKPNATVPDQVLSRPPQEQKVFVADELGGASTAPEPRQIAQDSVPAERPGRIVRPTFLRLREIDATLRNLSLDQASDEEEALTWLPVLRDIAVRADRLRGAIERLAGRDIAGTLPADEG